MCLLREETIGLSSSLPFVPLKRFVVDLKKAFAVARMLGVETILDSSPLNKTYAICSHSIGDGNHKASRLVLALKTIIDELSKKLICAPIRDVMVRLFCYGNQPAKLPGWSI